MSTKNRRAALYNAVSSISQDEVTDTILDRAELFLRWIERDSVAVLGTPDQTEQSTEQPAAGNTRQAVADVISLVRTHTADPYARETATHEASRLGSLPDAAAVYAAARRELKTPDGIRLLGADTARTIRRAIKHLS